jgi:uncharacterized protein YjbJ (UPF0337 family)
MLRQVIAGLANEAELTTTSGGCHMMNKNERNGAVDQAKGKVKQAVGTLTGNDKLKAEGQVDETAGKVESAVGQASREVGDAVTKVGKAIKR